jgi:ribose transport system substrate-binding protein
MKTSKLLVAVLALVLGLGLFAGCTRQEEAAPVVDVEESSTPAEVAPEETRMDATAEAPVVQEPAARQATPSFVVGMSQCNLGEPWRVQMNADIKKAADQHPELEVIFKDAQNDTLRQRAHIEEFVSAGVDLLMVSPLEAAPLTEPVAKAYQAGIPVVVLDRQVMGDQYTVFIGADNVLIGRAAGEWIVETLGGKGNVVELKGLMTSTPGQERHQGFIEAIQGTDIKVIFEADMKWLEPNARKEMESALARFDDIDLVYAHNDPAAHGAYLAASAMDRQDDITFVGIDGLPQEGQAYVGQGILDACLEYPTGGSEAVDVAIKLLNGESVPKTITVASRYFTPENIEQGGEWLSEAEPVVQGTPVVEEAMDVEAEPEAAE